MRMLFNTIKQPLLALILLLTLLIPSLVGCTPEGKELLISFAEEWANEKGINPKTAEGAWNIAKRTLGGSTGDEEADAAIDAGSVIKNMVEADKLMEEAEQESSYFAAKGKMKQAVDKRPDDWTYRITWANRALMSSPGSGDAVEQAKKGYDIVKKENNEKTTLKWASKNIEELEATKNKAEEGTTGAGTTTPTDAWGTMESQLVVHKQLAIYYDFRSQITGSATDKQVAQDYKTIVNQLNEQYGFTSKDEKDWRVFYP